MEGALAMTAVLVRSDGGVRVGLGHVRRCLSLSRALVSLGAHVIFAVNRSGQIPDLALAGVDVVVMDDGEISQLAATQAEARRQRAAIVVVDSYEFAPEALIPFPVPVAAIVDDPPPLELAARLLIDSSISAASKRWSVGSGTRLLLGPEYVLLREVFAAWPASPISRAIERVLVTTGGTDGRRCSGRLVRATRSVISTAEIDVVIGPYFPSESIEELQQLSARDPLVHLHRQADVPALMQRADLAISGGGQTSYELAATGTPSVAVCLAPNQMTNLRGLAERGTLLLAGWADDEDLESSVANCVCALGSAEARFAMRAAGREAVDGRGAHRVATVLLAECSDNR